MEQEEKKPASLPERLRDQLGRGLEALIGRLRDGLEELLSPPLAPVRIPVRSRGYRR